MQERATSNYPQESQPLVSYLAVEHTAVGSDDDSRMGHSGCWPVWVTRQILLILPRVLSIHYRLKMDQKAAAVRNEIFRSLRGVMRCANMCELGRAPPTNTTLWKIRHDETSLVRSHDYAPYWVAIEEQYADNGVWYESSELEMGMCEAKNGQLEDPSRNKSRRPSSGTPAQQIQPLQKLSLTDVQTVVSP